MEIETCIRFMTYLTCISLGVQTAEYLSLLNHGAAYLASADENPIWQNRSLRMHNGLSWLFGARFILLGLCLVEPFSGWIALLFLSQVAVMLWWRGPFNGGSDYMTLQVLLSLSLCSIFRSHPMVIRGVLFFTGIQVLFSYVVAGWVKIKSEDWRNGQALEAFLQQSIYRPLILTEVLRKRPRIGFAASWGIMLWELSFAVLFFPIGAPTIGVGVMSSFNMTVETKIYVCLFYIGTAIVFHFVNFILFGLNRFFLAWLSALPALAYLVFST